MFFIVFFGSAVIFSIGAVIWQVWMAYYAWKIARRLANGGKL